MASLIRFVHAAQARLDVPVSGFYDQAGQLSSSARVTLEDASLDAFDALVEKTRELQADALLLVGNTVRAADRSLRARRRLEEGLARLDEADIATIIAPGPLDPPATYKMLSMPDSSALLSTRDPRHSIRQSRTEVEFVLGNPHDEAPHGHSDAADLQIAVVPPDRDAELVAATAERSSRRFDPAHDLGRGPGIAYWALGAGVPTSTTLESSVAHDPGPLCPPSASFSGACGASLVEIDLSGGVRTTGFECSPVRCETVTVPLARIGSLEALAEAMVDRLPTASPKHELTVITWRLAGRGPVSNSLAAGNAWNDVVELIDDDAGRSRVHLRRLEPAADSLDDIALMLADEFRERIAVTDPDPRDHAEAGSPAMQQVLAAASTNPHLATRIRELGSAVFASDCDDLWKAA